MRLVAQTTKAYWEPGAGPHWIERCKAGGLGFSKITGERLERPGYI